MKNTPAILISGILIILVIFGLGRYFISEKSKELVPAEVPTASSTTAVVYNNSEYGFTVSLPESWKGFSIVTSFWEGNPLTATGTPQTGTRVVIRNPKWTSALPYQDIPVLVFTVSQWNQYQAEDFSVSAAPILASELGRNNRYVFALPPRWNFTYGEGYEEAERIVQSKPLTAFTVEN